MRQLFFFLFFASFQSAILAQATSDKKLFSTLPSSYTGVTFRNDIYEDNKFFYYDYMYLYNGAGVAVGDINNDGLQDIYFSSTTGFNKLYLNKGSLKFEDITDKSGVTGGMGIKTGVNMIDLNNDGWMDIVVSKSGPFDVAYRKKIIYINNKDLSFTDKSAELGLDEASHTTQTQFFDYDKDGDMDAFLVNHSMDFNNNMVINAKMENGKIVMIDDTARQYVSLRLYENRNGRFVDVSKKAGIWTHTFGLG
ncbi:MAG: VCBS repeat-containing protein, partial [Bacteroidota bacterium]